MRLKDAKLLVILSFIVFLVLINTVTEVIQLNTRGYITTERPFFENVTVAVRDLCASSGLKPWVVNKHWHNDVEDIFKLGPFNFLPNFKNPCWIDSSNSSTLRCLPYFYIIGSPKSGTTDIWAKLMDHPAVVKPLQKEAWWLCRTRVRKNPQSFRSYVKTNFEKAAQIISSHTITVTSKDGVLSPYYHMITGDGTVDTIFDNHLWPVLPGNENCSEPRYTNADYLKHLNPDMKLIVVLRNPIERVFSDFLYEAQFFGYNKTQEGFQDGVIESIKRIRKCRQMYSIRACMYNSSIEPYKARIQIGMYHLYLRDWFEVFPRHQFHIIRFDELVNNATEVFEKLLNFLELRKLSQSHLLKILHKPVRNSRSKKDKTVRMNNSTWVMLNDFYKFHNEQLSLLLGEKKYLEWNEG